MKRNRIQKNTWKKTLRRGIDTLPLPPAERVLPVSVQSAMARSAMAQASEKAEKLPADPERSTEAARTVFTMRDRKTAGGYYGRTAALSGILGACVGMIFAFTVMFLYLRSHPEIKLPPQETAGPSQTTLSTATPGPDESDPAKLDVRNLSWQMGEASKYGISYPNLNHADTPYTLPIYRVSLLTGSAAPLEKLLSALNMHWSMTVRHRPLWEIDGDSGVRYCYSEARPTYIADSATEEASEDSGWARAYNDGTLAFYMPEGARNYIDCTQMPSAMSLPEQWRESVRLFTLQYNSSLFGFVYPQVRCVQIGSKTAAWQFLVTEQDTPDDDITSLLRYNRGSKYLWISVQNDAIYMEYNPGDCYEAESYVSIPAAADVRAAVVNGRVADACYILYALDASAVYQPVYVLEYKHVSPEEQYAVLSWQEATALLQTTLWQPSDSTSGIETADDLHILPPTLPWPGESLSSDVFRTLPIYKTAFMEDTTAYLAQVAAAFGLDIAHVTFANVPQWGGLDWEPANLYSCSAAELAAVTAGGIQAGGTVTVYNDGGFVLRTSREAGQALLDQILDIEENAGTFMQVVQEFLHQREALLGFQSPWISKTNFALHRYITIEVAEEGEFASDGSTDILQINRVRRWLRIRLNAEGLTVEFQTDAYYEKAGAVCTPSLDWIRNNRPDGCTSEGPDGGYMSSLMDQWGYNGDCAILYTLTPDGYYRPVCVARENSAAYRWWVVEPSLFW